MNGEDQNRILFLAMDFGGTKGAASLCEAGARELLASRRFAVPQGAMGPDVFATMVETAHELLSGYSGTVAGVGVSFGGHVDAASGSGGSANVLRAAAYANASGATTIGFTGAQVKASKLQELCRAHLSAPLTLIE